MPAVALGIRRLNWRVWSGQPVRCSRWIAAMAFSSTGAATRVPRGSPTSRLSAPLATSITMWKPLLPTLGKPLLNFAVQGLYAQWVAGFVSGVNWDTDEPDILAEMDVDGLVAWVDSYCKANPLAKVTTGAAMLVRELRARSHRRHGP